MEIKRALDKTAIFKGLTEDEVGLIVPICHEQAYKKGEVVFAEKSKGNQVYIVKKGCVSVTLQIKGAADSATIHRINEGETFGELVLVGEGRRSASVSCETDCEIISIDKDDLMAVFESNTRIGFVTMKNLASVLATRLRKTDLQLIACFVWE